jgi:MarR family transcriptional regulator, lower aerobic nicotinate degradation pathway regulator
MNVTNVTANPLSSPDAELRAVPTMVLLARLAKQAMRRARPEELGIDLRLLMALSYLADHDGAPQQELADALCMDAKNVVLLLNELEDGGYLVRRRDAEDRRRHRVYITSAGRQALDRADQALQAIENEVLQALDPAQRATLGELVAQALRGAEPARAEACAPELASDVA